VHGALWLLLGLRFRAWLRRLGRNAATPRGALFLAAGLGFFLLILGPNIFLRAFAGEGPLGPNYLEQTRRYGPLMLLVYCTMTVLFSSAEQGIAFSPGEVQFLFPGPFSRRQLLAYKIAGNGLLCLLYALFLTAFFLPYVAWPVTAYLGLVLTLWFVQLFSTAVSLVIHTLGTRATGLPRKLLLLAAAGLLAWGALYAGRDALAGGPAEVLRRVERAPVLQAALTPLRWFVDAFTAERVWPDFAAAAACCLAVNAGLLLLVFLLDASYLEAAAAASERTYARLQRLRSGGAVAAGAWVSGKPRFSLPGLPWWGGAGPVAWRQLTTAARSLKPLLIFLAVFSVIAVGPRLVVPVQPADRPVLGWFLASTLLAMTFAVLTPLMTFDFRGDIDRMDVLKSLPIPPSRLALGQLLAPVLILTAVQVLVVGLVQLLWGGVELLLLLVVLYGAPFNFLSFGLENLLFLWFPTRMLPATPGDFQMMGRQTLMMFIKMLALVLVVLPAGLAWLAVALAGELLGVNGMVPGLAVAWVVLAGLSTGVLPLMARAFRAFDVARDTPP
jgi:hypothetical protein